MEWLTDNWILCSALGPISHVFYYPEDKIVPIITTILFLALFGHGVRRRRGWPIAIAITLWLLFGFMTFTSPI